MKFLIQKLLSFSLCKVSYSESTISSVSLNEDLALGLATLSQNRIITRNFCKKLN